MISKTKHWKIIFSTALFLFSLISSAEEVTAVSKKVTIKSKKVHESCIKLKSSQSINYRFKSSAKVDFNIHYHLGEKVKYPVKMDAIKEHTDKFTASFSQHYCLMWTNNGTDLVELEYSH